MKMLIAFTLVTIFFLGGIIYISNLFPGDQEWVIVQINEEDGDFGVLLMPVNEYSTFLTLEEAFEFAHTHLSHTSPLLQHPNQGETP